MSAKRMPKAVGLSQPYLRSTFVSRLLRNEIGVPEMVQVFLYLFVAARIAFGVDKTHGEPIRAGILLAIATVQVISGWRVWFYGLEGFDLRLRKQLVGFLVWMASSIGLFAMALTFTESAEQTTFAMSARNMLLLAVMVHGVGPFGTVVRTKFMALVPMAIVAVLALLHALDGQPQPWGLLLAGLVIGTIYGFVMRFTAWRTNVWDLWEQSQESLAQAAVTEERLRVSRDIHDVVGRALSAIAVKSELATELAKRGHADAIAEMEAVRELAHESMTEARRLSASYRHADVITEIAGARSLLNSAGVTTRLVGRPDVLPDHAKEILGWVVRESVTNIVRHSAATYSVMDISQTDYEAIVKISNDGVKQVDAASAAEPVRVGTGIAGLRERVVAVGGQLQTTREGNQFMLEARVPLKPRNLLDNSPTANLRTLLKS